LRPSCPGDGLTKLLWGFACNWIGPRFGNPNRLLHTIFFIAYLKATARDFIRLRFAWPKTLKLRWLLFKMFADQVLLLTIQTHLNRCRS
jgi:hypothetical protein